MKFKRINTGSKYLLLFIAALILSCQSKDEAKNTFVKTIEIIPSKDSIITLSSIIKNIKFIPLETNSKSLFGTAKKISFDKDKFVIFDEATTHAIFIFNREGKFLNRIKASDTLHSSKITGFCLDTIGKEILVGENFKKITRYNKDAKTLGSKPLNLFYKDFEMIENGNIAFSAAKFINYTEGKWYNRKPKELAYGLWIEDDSNELKKEFPFDVKIFPNGGEYTEIPRNFSSYNGKKYFNQTLNDTIYTINNGIVKPELSISFNKKTARTNLKNKPGKWLFEYFSNNPDTAFMVQNLIENDQFLKFDYFLGNTLQTAIKYKSPEKTVSGLLQNDLYGFRILLMQGFDKNHILSIVQPAEIFSLLKNAENIKFPWYANLELMAKNIKAGDNAVLIDLEIQNPKKI